MTGFQVDNITVGSFLDDCDGSPDSNTMTPSGEVWEAMFYDYFFVMIQDQELVANGKIIFQD